MSIAGGVYRAFERGSKAGCRTIQVFLKNSNQWNAKPLTEQDRELFHQAQIQSGIQPVTAHDSYLINLASPDKFLWKRSLDAFIDEMKRANFLGIPNLVMHPGAHVGSGIEVGIAKIAEAIQCALETVEGPVSVVLESTAGQGSSIGHRFEQLAGIIERIPDSKRIGVCLDTCHLFAAGYDIRTKECYETTMRDFDRLIGIRRIRAFHVNDSKKELGSRVDRHAHIGEGCIGLQGFRWLVNDRRFARIPKILETPKGPDLKEDIRNLAVLRSLLTK
jgi:deoxyribonuclease IV